MTVINNIPHTTYTVDEGLFGGADISVSCESGYTFVSAPTVTYKNTSGTSQTQTMRLNAKKTTATYDNEEIDLAQDITFNGSVSGGTPEPVAPHNNVAHTTALMEADKVTLTCDEGYIFDGSPKISFDDDPFADEVTMTVSQDGKTATYSQADLGTQQITITGKTKSAQVDPVVTNNVANTTVNVSGDTVTLTCADGYIFDGVPVVTKGSDNIPMTVSGDNKTATLTSQGIGSTDITITGNTKIEPVSPDPVVTNNIEGASETHTKDGATALTINLTSNELMRNVTVSYTNTSGESVSLPVTVEDTSTYGEVHTRATVSLTDVDFNVAVVLSGSTISAIHITFTLSGCRSSSEPTYLILNEPLSLTLTADEGNEFTDPTKVYYRFEGALSDPETYYLTISEDKLTATATIVNNTTDNEHLNVVAEALPKAQPAAKYGFINAYVVTEENLNKFATSRFVQYTGGFYPVTYDLGDYVNRVKRYFFKVDEGSTSKLTCGNFIVDTDVKNLASDRKIINFGDVYIPNYTQSAADYSSDVMMFLPFIGLVNVGSEIIGKTVNLTLKVNVLSGDGVYVLTCGDNMVWSKEVAPCTDVIYRTTDQDPKVIGDNNFDATFLMGLRPYVLVDRREIMNNGSQSPSSLAARIGDLTGNVKLTDVVFSDTENMLQYDINEIVSILRQGISL